MKRRVTWILGAAAIAAVAIAAGVQQRRAGVPADEAANPVAYKEVVAERGRFRLAVSANGLVRPIDRIELKSKASGAVIELPIEVGDRIEKGALIAKLDQVDERAALSQAQADLVIAQAELDLAEKNYARRAQLLSSDVISRETQDQTELELAVARSKLVQATTALERAGEQMEDTVVTAPVAGVILQKYVERGQIIASGVSNVGGGTPIVDVADMSNVHIEAGIDEIDIGKIAVGQRATVWAEAYPDHAYSGEVVRIAPEARVEQNVTLFDVVIEVANTDGNLKSGMNATVEVVIVDRPDVLLVPVAALQARGAQPGERPPASAAPTVLVKEASGYVPRAIRTGITDHRVIEVLEGLSAGDVIGIPMVSRLKQEHDRMDARMRDSQSFGTGTGSDTRPKAPGG